MTQDNKSAGLVIVERLRQPTLAPSVNTLRNEAADTIERLYGTSAFLGARLREFEEFVPDNEGARQWFGHVLPALERLETTLAKARGQ